MLKPSFPLSLVAVAALAACTTYRIEPSPVIVQAPPAPTVVAQPGTVVLPAGTISAPPTVVAQTAPPLRAGVGLVEAIATLPQSASAGASQPSAIRRIGLRMNDGTLQFLDTDAPSVALGDRIEITADGFLRRPAS
jgi:hypothetical protein